MFFCCTIPHRMETISRLFLLAPLAAVSITVTAQLENPGFEDTSIIGEDTIPDGWSIPTGFGAGAAEDAHTGDWSLGVWHWYWYATGMANNGSGSGWLEDGAPYSGTPAALSGWFKRITGELDEDQSENDSALVLVLLTRWNASLSQRDTVALGRKAFGEQAEWSAFTAPMDYLLQGPPDTLVVQVYSGIDCFCGTGTSGNCCYLYVDDLALETENGVHAALPAHDPAWLVACGGGQLEARVDGRTALPLVLRMHDTLGRTIGELVVRNDRDRFMAPAGAGLIKYRFSERGSTISTGKVIAY